MDQDSFHGTAERRGVSMGGSVSMTEDIAETIYLGFIYLSAANIYVAFSEA